MEHTLSDSSTKSAALHHTTCHYKEDGLGEAVLSPVCKEPSTVVTQLAVSGVPHSRKPQELRQVFSTAHCKHCALKTKDCAWPPVHCSTALQPSFCPWQKRYVYKMRYVYNIFDNLNKATRPRGMLCRRRKIKNQSLKLSLSAGAVHHKTYHPSNADSYHLTVTDFCSRHYVTILFQKPLLKQLESGATSFSVNDFTFVSPVSSECFSITPTAKLLWN